MGALHPHPATDTPAARTCMHCEICGDTPVTKTIAGLAFACENCCNALRPAAPARLDMCRDCNQSDNAGSWGNGLDAAACATRTTPKSQRQLNTAEPERN